jgi:hypothetical protein
MRYTITSNDEQGLIGIQLAKWAKEGKLEIIEKSETLVEIQAKLDKVAQALKTLKKAGYNSEVMKIFVQKKTGLPMNSIEAMLGAQENFLKQVGALK